MFKKTTIYLLSIVNVICLTSCSKVDDRQSNAANIKNDKVVLKMEMDENYSNFEPIRNGLLFCVTKDIETLDAEVFYRMDGERGTVEIKERNTDDILWSNTWDESVNINVFVISLNNLKEGKEYVVEFTGTNIMDAVVKVTFDSDFVQEKARPST